MWARGESDRGTQELKILALVDRLKWLMHVKAVIPVTGMHDFRRLTSNSTFVSQGSASEGDGIWAIVFQGGNGYDEDKEW